MRPYRALALLVGALGVVLPCWSAGLHAEEPTRTAWHPAPRTPGSPAPTIPCEILRDHLLGRAVDPVGSADQSERDATVRDVESALPLPGANPGETCAATIAREIAGEPYCGSAAELITSAMGRLGALSASTLRAALRSTGSCTRAIVAGVASVPHVDASTADTVLAWSAAQHDPATRAGGLVVAGSLAHTARTDGDDRTAERVDQAIAGALSRAVPDGVVEQLLEAAGNAGCVACADAALRRLRSPANEVRLSAVAALRFVATPTAAPAMCRALLGDAAVDVREQAGWALRWERGGMRERVACLVTSAARDRSARVRAMAVTSLGVLAHDDRYAMSALLHLTSEEYDPRVVSIANETLDGMDEYPRFTPPEARDSTTAQ